MSKAAPRRKAVGYVRVSRVNGRDKLGDSFISPDVQRETIERLAAAKGARIVAWFEDLDQSGGKYERPDFQAALAACEAGDADLFLVAKLSRFARSAGDTHRALERLEAAGASMSAGDLDVDLSTPIGRAILGIFAVMAALELEVARENWMVARERAAANGKFPGSLPLGYRRSADRRVELDPVLAPGVAELFRGRADGLPFTELAEAFTRRTRRALHPQSVDKLLANPAYLGELSSGKLTLPVEPIVTQAEWQAAQSVTAPRPARSATGSLLAGILRCGSCGRPMSFRGGKSAQYTCQRFAGGERCQAPVLIGGAKIDELVEAAFLERHAGSGATGTPADREEVAAAQRALDRARADLAATLALDLGAGGDLLAEAAAVKAAAIEAAELALEELSGSERLGRRLEKIGERWPELELEERRRLLAAAIESVTVHRVGPGSRVPIEERTTILFAGDEPPAATAAAGRAAA